MLKLAIRKQWGDFFKRTGDWQQYPVGPPPRRPTIELFALGHKFVDGPSRPTGQSISVGGVGLSLPLVLADRQCSLVLLPPALSGPAHGSIGRSFRAEDRHSPASSSGTGAVPLVATTLRELREMNSRAIATASVPTEPSVTSRFVSRMRLGSHALQDHTP